MVIIADNKIVPESPEFARFPYPLSPFQKHAIYALLEGKSVLVTAHTGSGKTVPAEFAIQHFVEAGKKVIYCSPIKALSNQKFYEFQRKYPGVSFGLLTGDNKINPAADCLIMTTEILMNQCVALRQEKEGLAQEKEGNKEETKNSNNSSSSSSSSSPLLHFQMNLEEELAAVVFDEVHYINDAHRGHVWEKTLMMLPLQVQLVLLSATIDQPVKFAEWLESMEPMAVPSKRSLVLCSNEHRVVPLGHYSFVTYTEALFKKVKDKATEQEVKRVCNQLRPLQTAQGQFQAATYHDIQKTLDLLQKHRVDMKRKYVVNKLLAHLTEDTMIPALLFLFSRKQVEQVAAEVTTTLLPFDSKVPYMARHDAEAVLRDKLPNWREYVALPEFDFLVSLLEKGIGIHHAGMVPVFREIVELFIARRHIYLLVATESFAIGLDCPIKSTIFLGFMKWDGRQDRLLMPHEYTQMAGRAGRRGIDTIGYVIHCHNLFQAPPLLEYQTMLSGRPETFVSKFAVTYDLVLQGMVGGKSRDEIVAYVEQSMAASQLQRQTKAQQKALLAAEAALLAAEAALDPGLAQACANYRELREMLPQVGHKRRKEVEREMESLSLFKGSSLAVEMARRDQHLLCHKRCREEATHLSALQGYVGGQVDMAAQVLERLGFLSFVVGGHEVTWQGRMATQLREVDGLLVARLLHDTRLLEGWSAAEVVALLSCFAEVRGDKEQEETQQGRLWSAYRGLCVWRDDQESVEALYPAFDGVRPTTLQPRLMAPLLEWCQGCGDEGACRAFLQRLEVEVGMSVGDFVKVVLKIVAVTKELERALMADTAFAGQTIPLLHVLSQVEPMVAKYVMTSQSLYL